MGAQVELHSLVLASLSDHYTRLRQTDCSEPPRQAGVLLGSQSGRNVALKDSFELKLNPDDSVDTSFLSAKLQQVSAVCSDHSPVGWYIVGGNRSKPDVQHDYHIHQSLEEHNERPLVLVFDAATLLCSEPESLPASMFEPELRVEDGVPKHGFREVPYTLEAEEAERVAVDDATRILPSGYNTTTAELSTHYGNLQSALSMLVSRLERMYKYIIAVANGEMTVNRDVLRRIQSVLDHLPAVSGEQYYRALRAEEADALTSVNLGSMTQGLVEMGEFVEKFGSINERSATTGGRRRVGPSATAGAVSGQGVNMA